MIYDKCFYCGKQLSAEQQKDYAENAETCCSGHECACMGLPIEPPSCGTKECVDSWNNIKKSKEEVK